MQVWMSTVEKASSGRRANQITRLLMKVMGNKVSWRRRGRFPFPRVTAFQLGMFIAPQKQWLIALCDELRRDGASAGLGAAGTAPNAGCSVLGAQHLVSVCLQPPPGCTASICSYWL